MQSIPETSLHTHSGSRIPSKAPPIWNIPGTPGTCLLQHQPPHQGTPVWITLEHPSPYAHWLNPSSQGTPVPSDPGVMHTHFSQRYPSKASTVWSALGSLGPHLLQLQPPYQSNPSVEFPRTPSLCLPELQPTSQIHQPHTIYTEDVPTEGKPFNTGRSTCLAQFIEMKINKM